MQLSAQDAEGSKGMRGLEAMHFLVIIGIVIY
jgi:hypothetical protein